MPFGLARATATFQKAIDSILSHLKWKGVVCYIDDVLIGGETFDEHLKLLDQVLAAVSNAGFTISPKKCELALTSIKFLGYIISHNGIEPDPSKVDAIQNFKEPKNQKEIKSFIGALSYYRQFIENFSSVAEPLLRLTRKDIPFTWEKEQIRAFQHLKEVLITAPVLKPFDHTRNTMLKTDASAYGVGAILEQEYSDFVFLFV